MSDLSTARKAAGKTQVAAALELGTSQATISKIEHGIRLPCPKLSRRIKKLYGVTIPPREEMLAPNRDGAQ